MFEKLDEEWTKRYANIGPEPKLSQGGGVKEQMTEGCGQIRVQPGTKTEARVRTKPGLEPRARTTDPEDPEDHWEEPGARTQVQDLKTEKSTEPYSTLKKPHRR